MRYHQRLDILVIAAMVSAASYGGTLYVDDNATGANNGTSWADAYLYLQDALAVAGWADTICVAQGTYRPDESAYLDGLIDDDRRASFTLKMGVTLLGGFAGVGAGDPDARDVVLYPTILSGDLEGNDPAEMDLGLMLNAISREDNSIHVVVGTGTNNSAALDGFTITGGNANVPGYDGEWVSTEYGGGLYNAPGDCIVRDCVFVANSAQAGGGVYNRDGSRPVFVNCRFRRNVYSGMYNDTQSSPTLDDCVFEEHLRSGVANYDRSSPILTECRFSRNGSEYDFGGGICNGGGSSPVIQHCLFEDNFSGQRGGALYFADKSNAAVTDCMFRRNRGTWFGGAVFSELSSPVFQRCVFEDNESNSGGAISVGNWSWYEGANSEVKIENCLFRQNRAIQQGPVVGRGGAISAIIWQQNRLSVTNCTFAGNTAPQGRALLFDSFMHNSASEVIVKNCILWDGGDEIVSLDKTVVAQYSNIQGGYDGQANLNAPPMFVDSEQGDFRLMSESPCVDKGDNTVVAEGTIDLNGNLRIRGQAVDMGAYELPIELGAIIYVDDNAPGTNKGTNWENALWRLQDAIALAQPGQEIRVSEGTYRPAGPNGSRWASFQLKSGVAIKGGYDGYGAADPDARDVKAFKTILSGDLDGSMGELTKESFASVMVPRYSSTTASYHVVMAAGVDATAVLDGFTITGGVANGSGFDTVDDITSYDGGGIYCVNASPTLVDCTIRGNCVVFTPGGAGPMGGGMYNLNGNPTLTRCVFELNAADDWDSDSMAGGLMNYFGEIRLTECVFSDNRSYTSGGGIYNAFGKVVLERCRFEGNHARSCGAISNERGELILRNCMLVGNSAESSTGGIGNYGPCIVTHCTFAGNSNYAFAHFLFEDKPSVISNCIFWDGGQEILASEGDLLEVRFSDVQGGWPGQGNLDVEPLFAGSANGDYRLKSQAGRWNAVSSSWVRDAVTSPCIDAGDPYGSIGLEPFPNGGVVNLGFDGGTAEASKSWFGGDCAAVYAGDINGDCRVDLADLAILSQHWLVDGSGPR